MIGLIMGLGAGKRLAQFVAYVGLPLLLIVGALLALDAWGDRRFRAGEDAREAVWKAASDATIAKAATSADAATRKEVPRLVEQAAKIEREKDLIDAAIENGTSPVDALFPVVVGNGL